MNELTQAHELIDLALTLVPEDEGIDLTDLELSIEDTVRVKNALSRMRSAIDSLNRALAEAWQFNHPDTKSIEIGDDLYFLKPYSGKQWAPDGAISFALWAVKQAPEDLARMISPNGIKVGQIPPEVRNEVLNEEPRNDQPRIQSMPAQLTRRK